MASHREKKNGSTDSSVWPVAPIKKIECRIHFTASKPTRKRLFNLLAICVANTLEKETQRSRNHRNICSEKGSTKNGHRCSVLGQCTAASHIPMQLQEKSLHLFCGRFANVQQIRAFSKRRTANRLLRHHWGRFTPVPHHRKCASEATANKPSDAKVNQVSVQTLAGISRTDLAQRSHFIEVARYHLSIVSTTSAGATPQTKESSNRCALYVLSIEIHPIKIKEEEEKEEDEKEEAEETVLASNHCQRCAPRARNCSVYMRKRSAAVHRHLSLTLSDGLHNRRIAKPFRF